MGSLLKKQIWILLGILLLANEVISIYYMIDNSHHGNNGVIVIALLFALNSLFYQIFGAIVQFEITKNDILNQFSSICQAWNKHVANLLCESSENAGNTAQTEVTPRNTSETT